MSAPNHIWTADFKGQFKTLDGKYCYPLTVVDGYSRFLLGCQALDAPQSILTRPVFHRLFREYGLPQIIRTDNGAPFATATALARLSRLSVWWIQSSSNLSGPAEWTTRTHAPHPQTGGHHSPRQLTIRTATPLHPLPPRIQPRKAARSPGPEYTSGNLPALLAAFTQKAATATLSRTLGSATRQQQRGRTMEGRSSACQLYTEKTIRRI